MKEQLIALFENYGIDPLNAEEVAEMDSLQYIGILIEIENTFQIELPDEYLENNMFEDMDSFFQNVCAYIENTGAAAHEESSNSGETANT